MNILTIFHYVPVYNRMCYNLNPEGLHPSVDLSASGFISHSAGYTWLRTHYRTHFGPMWYFVSNTLSLTNEISVKPVLIE